MLYWPCRSPDRASSRLPGSRARSRKLSCRFKNPQPLFGLMAEALKARNPFALGKALGLPVPVASDHIPAWQNRRCTSSVQYPRRGSSGAAPEDLDHLVGGAARTLTPGKAAPIYRGATTRYRSHSLRPDVRKAFRRRGTACRPLRIHCRRTRKRRGTPRGCPCGGQARGLPLRRDRAQGVGGSVNRRTAPWFPHSPCGTPGRASPTPTSPDCIHPFERRLRLCGPEVAMANSSWELTVGSASQEKFYIEGGRENSAKAD